MTTQPNAIPLAKMSDINAHTPGPWEACERGDYADFDGDSVVILGDEVRIAALHHNGSAEAEANARLIAAAPVMLAALQQFANPKNWVLNGCFDPNSGNFEGIRFAAAAIAKATTPAEAI